MEKSKQAKEDFVLVEILRSDASTNRDKQSAFRRLYLKHEDSLLYFFLKKNCSHEEAEDLKMITFEKINKNIDKYISNFAFSTWMYKIAVNTLIDKKRKEKNKKNIFSIDKVVDCFVGEVEEGLQIKCFSPNPEQKLIKKELVQKVMNAINEIKNPMTRKLMKHRFIDEMSFEEISKQLGVSNNSSLRVKVIRETERLSIFFKKP